MGGLKDGNRVDTIVDNIRREFDSAGITPAQNRAIWMWCLLGSGHVSVKQFSDAVEAARRG